MRIAVGRDLVPLLVDLPLLAGAEGLVGGQGVDRDEAGAVAREAVGGHHADPGLTEMSKSPYTFLF